MAKRVKYFVEDQLSNAKKINLLNVDRGKYFRILADVEYDGINLTGILIEKGYAIPYDGGTKID